MSLDALLRDVQSTPELDLDTLAHDLATAADAAGCVVLLVDEAGTALRLAAAWPRRSGKQPFRIAVGYGVVGLVAANGSPTLLADDSPRDTVHRAVLGLAPGESVARMCLPLLGLPGSVLGVIAIHRGTDRPFPPHDPDRLASVVGALGLRLQAEQLQRRARATDAVHSSLIANAISAQEAERRRIAGDLHDGVTQALVSLDYHLSAASAGLGGLPGSEPTDPAGAGIAAVAEQIRAARALSGLAYDEARAAISGLHSLILDDLGLPAALESLAQTVGGGAPGLSVDFVSDPPEVFDDVPEHVAAAFYRIAQEAANNVVKHADASRVTLSLRRAGEAVLLAIKDDGVGFDKAVVEADSLVHGDAEHYGLSSIAERCALLGASLRIDSAEGRGTAVIVEHRNLSGSPGTAPSPSTG